MPKLQNHNRNILKTTVLLLCFVMMSFGGSGQTNLVPNYSFENYIICPVDYNSPPPPPWYLNCTQSLKAGYLNACTSDYCTSVPYNCVKGNNYQLARTGDAYVFLDYVNGLNDREYIQILLTDSLKANHCYYIEFYVNLPNPMKFACNNNGLLFTKNSFYVDTLQNPYAVYPTNPQILSYGNPIITDTLGWQKISSVYTAQGGERFITLGNFKYDNQTTLLNVNPLGYHGAGYIIDDVSVIPLDSFCLKADAGKDTAITLGDSVFIGSYTNGIDSLKWFNGNTVIDSLRPGFWVHPTVTTSYILQQVINGCFSADTVLVTVGTVPLKMLGFTAMYQPTPNPSKEGNVLLQWQTANEVNVSHFNIQRSTSRSLGTKDFITIGKLSANNKSYNEYSFIDVQFPSLEGLGVGYYRIESVDNDGKKQYSEIRKVELGVRNGGISIYPNPAKDQVTIECKGAKEILMIDYLGRQIYHFVRNDGSLLHQAINTKQFNKGIYIVKAIMVNGDIKTEKLVVE